jgi:hypothetical protein
MHSNVKVLRKWRKTSARHLTNTFSFHRTKLYSIRTFTELSLVLSDDVKFNGFLIVHHSVDLNLSPN